MPDEVSSTPVSKRNEPILHSLIRHPALWGFSICGVFLAALQVAGIVSVPIAEWILFAGWLSVCAEVYLLSSGLATRLKNSLVLALCCLTGVGFLWIGAWIYILRAEQYLGDISLKASDIAKPSDDPSILTYTLPSPSQQHPRDKQLNSTTSAINRGEITAESTAEIVARLYLRGPVPPPGTTGYIEPHRKELFYDWRVTITCTKDETREITVSISDRARRSDERFRVEPTIGTVSDSTPAWVSGFTEPREPDYYLRTVRFPNGLSLGQTATITVRRPLKFITQGTQIDQSEFVKTFSVRAEGADVTTKKSEPRADQLFKQLGALLTGAGGTNIPIVQDPDEPIPPIPGGNAEAVVELRCADSDCNGKLNLTHVTYRAGSGNRPY